MKKEIGLYIHIPFCIKKCNYCDFTSFRMNEVNMKNYVYSLEQEIASYEERLNNYEVATIFIGGGTPSILSQEQLTYILNSAYKYFNVSKSPEITIESNPGTLSKEKLLHLNRIGVNRLSIGLQSFNDEHLKNIGRIHTVEDFIKQYNIAREVGFENINIDLIYGLPNQTLDDWEKTITNVVKLAPEHISAYSLKIEEGTKFYDLYTNNDLTLPSEEIDRLMYHDSLKLLKDNGYFHYEISNFAKPGYECRHNIIYWHNYEYLGLGVSAHSYLDRVRFSNTCNLQDYESYIQNKMQPIISRETKTLNDEIFETMFLELRLREGVNILKFNERFGINPLNIYINQLNKLMNLDLIEIVDGFIRLTNYGIDVSNQVFMEFILD